MNPFYPLTRRRLERIEELLREAAMDKHELAGAIHMDVRWVGDYINHLFDNHLHIEKWERKGDLHEYPVASYRWGRWVDAPKPAPLTSKVKARMQRARIKADPERRDVYLSRQRALKRKIVVDPMVNALFGLAARAGHSAA